MGDRLNEARAMRVAELVNDYRTLMLHISQQNIASRPEEYNEHGFVVVRDCQAAAQRLMAANYFPVPVVGHNNAETEKAELQRVITDSSARRFQAHKIYLRAAAARRWAMARESALRGQTSTAHQATALKAANTGLQQELARITDQHVISDLRTADLRAGHWVDDDPSLDVVCRWLQGR